MLMPHQIDELTEVLQEIKDILYSEDEIVHLPSQIDDIKEKFEEVEEIIELD